MSNTNISEKPGQEVGSVQQQSNTLNENIEKPLIKQGWLRALIFLVPFIGIALLLQYVGSLLTYNVLGLPDVEMGDNFQTIFQFFISTLGTVLVVWFCRRFIDRKSFMSLGFNWDNYANDAWLGFFTAPALLGIGTLVLMAMSHLQFGSVNFNLTQLSIELFLMLLIAFSEELIIRGYILNNLLQSFNKWIALAISAAFFALLHLDNPDASILSLINILCAGFLLGINYIYTKNLWFGIFFHFAWNFFQGPIFGYEVSGLDVTAMFEQNLSGPLLLTGGGFGFEGSLICLLLTIIATFIYAKFYSTKYVVA